MPEQPHFRNAGHPDGGDLLNPGTRGKAPHVSIAIAVYTLLRASIGTLAPAFFALISIVAPPRVRSAAFSTISVFAIPGIAVFLPPIGTVSDRLGIQASMVVLVPIALVAGFVLASASRNVIDNIATANTAVATA